MIACLLAHTDGPAALVARLLYGTGMRLMEGMRLRIKDVDFDRHVIIVRDAKGGKDRVVMLPSSLEPALHLQMLAARAQWEADRQAQRGGVETPHALEQKYPKVGYTWGWFWTFPSPTLSIDPAQWCGTQTPLVRRPGSACTQKGRVTGGNLQTGLGSHAASLFRHASAASGHRHPNGARVAGTQRRFDHHDLHPRAQGGGRWNGQSAGCAR